MPTSERLKQIPKNLFHTDPGEVIPLIPRDKAREAVKEAAASAQVAVQSAPVERAKEPQRDRTQRSAFQPLTLIGPGVAARAADKHASSTRNTKPSAVVPEARAREGVIIPAKKETPIYEVTDVVRPVKYQTFEQLGLGKPKKAK